MLGRTGMALSALIGWPDIENRGMLRVKEGLFDRVRGKRAGEVVRGRGFHDPAETAQQVGACRMEQVVAVQGRRTQFIYGGQSRDRTADFSERDGAVECDYRSGRQRVELIVERQDGAP